MHVISSGVWELIPIRAFLGFCIGGVLPSLYSFISTNTPTERKGGVMGIASGFTLLGNLIGPLASGYIAAYTSINFIFILSGLVLIAGAFTVYKNIKDTKPKKKQEPPVIMPSLSNEELTINN
jgi:DHA1 family multidrug resistance protein-like MFS transporter